jgi:hypothetical protein
MLWHCLFGINMANACIIVVDEVLIAIINYNIPNMCLMKWLLKNDDLCRC